MYTIHKGIHISMHTPTLIPIRICRQPRPLLIEILAPLFTHNTIYYSVFSSKQIPIEQTLKSLFE